MPNKMCVCPVCGAYCLDIGGDWYISRIQCRIHGKFKKNRARSLNDWYPID